MSKPLSGHNLNEDSRERHKEPYRNNLNCTGDSETAPKRRIGLLGGAFNPPHSGHLRLAALAQEQLALDELRFVPTAGSPYKPAPAGDAALRLGQLEAALGVMGGSCRIDTIELDRGGISYTVDTLEALTLREPDCAWIWIMGSDQVEAFGSWRNGMRILELASLAVAPRPGFGCSVPESLTGCQREAWSGATGELIWLPSTELDISSSSLRAELAIDRVPESATIQVPVIIDRKNK